LWRSIAERHDPQSLDRLIGREFVAPPERVTDEATRRQFLRVMGASLALAGAQGCDTQQPAEAIVPYVQQPEYLVPGKPLYYATAMEHDQSAHGLLVESHMFRPTKVEGNPLHPAVPEIMRAANDQYEEQADGRIRYGPTTPYAQSSVLTLYDPDRSQVLQQRGEIHTWENFVAALRGRVDQVRDKQGAGISILTETALSPALRSQIVTLQAELPQLRWYQWEPLHCDHAILGSRMAFGEDLLPYFHVDQAEVIVALDADFLATGRQSVRAAHAFAHARQAAGTAGNSMNRLYVLETAYTLTGSAADHRLPVRPDEIEAFARLLAANLGLDGGLAGDKAADERLGQWTQVIADDLRQARESGRGSLILAGRWQSPAVHALVHWMNSELGNVGRSLEYRRPSGQSSLQTQAIGELVAAMQDGSVESLLILGGNPAYTAPADLDFSQRLAQVPFTAHLSLYRDETSAMCDWHVPQAHYLESWSDTQAEDGTVSIIQPLIAPLYGGKTAHEVLGTLSGAADTGAYERIREYWRTQWEQSADGELSFDERWQAALHDGVIAGTAQEPIQVSIRGELAKELAGGATGGSASSIESSIEEPSTEEAVTSAARGLVAAFRPDPSVWDGRFANNAWLQELPRPFTKLTWDNAAVISPATARAQQLRAGDVVAVSAGERQVRIPVWVLPGQPDGIVGLHVGYGRTRAGEVGNGVGTNVYPLRTSDAQWFVPVTLRKVGEQHSFATTQHHHLMEGRHLVRHGTLEEYRGHPEHPPFVHPPHFHAPAPEETLYPQPDYDGYKWGMSIDLSKCIGCSACVLACQAENNVPAVGKDQVAAGREMHWLRIDHYYSGPPDAPDSVESFHQPMLCQHCEYAPCEVVCPVFATTHSSEGLNEMTYNRCVGTRYCSNNCPYKVRRFNFFDYNALLRETPILQLLPNPDVTVRSRGVMEKCTFCVQRISQARIHAEKNGRRIHDGEVVTACQAACPSEAIVFGDLNDHSSRVREHSASPLGYGVLAELNTRPRITYLAAVKNPNPALGESRGVPGEEVEGSPHE
jgi:molybdopterin-containing oxidoreductase family iron-sulfur binding subunit